MGNIINPDYINSDLLPLEVNESPWLVEKKNDNCDPIDIGKWMLFYDKLLMNDAWSCTKKLFRENKLTDIISMKCSTAFENPRASTLDEGVIILYCSDSSNKEKIMNVGKNILKLLNYKKRKYIYYKTDNQSRNGTRATGTEKNYEYKIYNHLYKGKCLIKL
tara:strand:- start:1172 stop:1657 length:486 start_codon:yes stop_codon:yes gene_type:complete